MGAGVLREGKRAPAAACAVLPATLLLALAACGEGGGEQAPAASGREAFADAGCGLCHTLSAAGATGSAASNLDEKKPKYERALRVIRDGAEGMPAYGSQLGEGELERLAKFVAEAARG